MRVYIIYTKTGTFGKMFSAGYLGLGRRYEARVCTIVISMNGAFQDEFGPKIMKNHGLYRPLVE